jgi:hypothetical protein
MTVMSVKPMTVLIACKVFGVYDGLADCDLRDFHSKLDNYDNHSVHGGLHDGNV